MGVSIYRLMTGLGSFQFLGRIEDNRGQEACHPQEFLRTTTTAFPAIWNGVSFGTHGERLLRTSYSRRLIDLTLRMLAILPSDRPTIAQILNECDITIRQYIADHAANANDPLLTCTLGDLPPNDPNNPHNALDPKLPGAPLNTFYHPFTVQNPQLPPGSYTLQSQTAPISQHQTPAQNPFPGVVAAYNAPSIWDEVAYQHVTRSGISILRLTLT